MATYASTITATPGLQAYWRLGEPSGTNVVDSSGNGRDLTLVTGTVAQAGLLTGDANTAYSFNGSSDWAWNTVTGIDFATADQLSVEAWVTKSTTDTYDFFISLVSGASGPTIYRYGTGPDGKPYWNTNATDRTQGTAVSTTATHHIVVTAGIETGAVVTRYYVDGALNTSISEGHAALADADTIAIGASLAGGGANHYWPGKIDEVAVYNTVLTPAQVTAHYNAGLGIFPSGVSRIRRQFQLRPY